MEAQSFLYGLCPNSATSLLQKPGKSTAVRLLSSSSSLFIESQKWISLKTHCTSTLVSQKVGNRKRLECRNRVEVVGDLTESEKVSMNGVRRKKLAVFVSGGGSNFRSIHEAIVQGSIHGDVVVLVTNKPGCGGAEFARDCGIPVILFPKTKDAAEGLSLTDLITSLRKFEVDIILLAGYLKLIPDELVRAYPRSILNIHPSLLPAFGGKGYYGMKVHKAVIASGARYSGPTIHFVDENYDTGCILAQRVVPVLANDTAEKLAERVLHEEHQLYVEVTGAFCEERVTWREDGVPLIRSRENPNKYS
ncbi:phosphoribosylglycinamide formyltransferase, chloroplastic-like [Telopea speciosissima]|uniref:phosphoribosylglycinamide formyltransferase, chloroplastic-like n=1 Tax=Telopea speciosissima TaxID=54955 RepID=UPI001CC4CDF0|nr:phosphoribosylglycinamide formyltransferase, chloroplastic-like [Telopea speciosissima]XP_043692510.1 phosphoribosylglycinamide formyltransferase, chloroplastic-like [Telopea speciosissima]